MPNHYAVRRGRKPGIYPDWPAAKEQVDRFRGAQHRRFYRREDAEAYLRGEDPPPPPPPPPHPNAAALEAFQAAREASRKPAVDFDPSGGRFVVDAAQEAAPFVRLLRAVGCAVSPAAEARLGALGLQGEEGARSRVPFDPEE